MPALDYCHQNVVHALQNDGWIVDPKPVRITADERTVFIDIQARKPTNGRSQQILLAEVKCFPDRKSTTNDLYVAFGQYVIYRALLAELNIGIPLFLAVPQEVYTNIFDNIVQRSISDNNIKLIVIHLDTERIVQWIT